MAVGADVGGAWPVAPRARIEQGVLEVTTEGSVFRFLGLSASMQAGWTAFARTGVPACPDGHPWPVFDVNRPEITHIGDTIERRPLAPTELTRILHGLCAG